MEKLSYEPNILSFDDLRALVVAKLEQAGFSFNEDGTILIPSDDKDIVRKLHEPARNIELQSR